MKHPTRLVAQVGGLVIDYTNGFIIVAVVAYYYIHYNNK
jgi:hypothetical protein